MLALILGPSLAAAEPAQRMWTDQRELCEESWNIILIDHSRAFIERKNVLKEDTKLPQYDRKLVKRLQALTREELEAEIEVLRGREINAIFTRRDKILEHQQKARFLRTAKRG